MRREKRILSFVLSVLMIVCSVSSVTYAAETQSEIYEESEIQSGCNVFNVNDKETGENLSPGDVSSLISEEFIENDISDRPHNLWDMAEMKKSALQNSVESQLFSDCVLSFVGKSSIKYITTHDGSIAAGTNVYQKYSNTPYPHSKYFRVRYSKNGASCTISPLDANGDAFNYLKCDYDNIQNGMSTNLEVSYMMPTNSYHQWIIEFVDDNYCVIRLSGKPNMVITTTGLEDGTSYGNYVGAQGNIYVSEYTGANNQLWYVYSGGKPVIWYGDNIKEVSEENINDINLGDDYMAYYCVVDKYGDKVSWKSSNTTVVKVNTSGAVRPVKIGKATISATVTYSDGTTTVYSKTLYVTLENGVYKITNVYSGKKLDVDNACGKNYTNVIQFQDGGSNRLNQLWRIRYIGEGSYTLRPLHLMTAGLDVTNGNVDIYNITDDDYKAPDYAKWTIEETTGGMILKNNGSNTKTLRIEGTTANLMENSVNVGVGTYVSGQNVFCWTFSQVTNPPCGIRFVDTNTGYYVNNPTRYIPNGSSKSMSELNLKVVCYGNTTIYTVNPALSSNISVAQVSNGIITAKSEGNVSIYAGRTIGATYVSAYMNVNVTIAEGTYFFKNREKLKHMQPDNNGESHMEHHDLNGNSEQIWQIVFDGSNYYRIKNKNTGLYLTVQNSTSSGKSVKQEEYSSSDIRQLWEFTKLEMGSYKIKSKFHIDNNTNLVLAVGWGINWNGTNVEQREFNDENNKDEWLLEKTVVSYIERESQNKTNWCWVTSARMFAKNSYSDVTRTQKEAVKKVKGSAINEGGNNDEIIEAIDYYIGNIESVSIDSVSYVRRVYSEDVIKKFIDDGYVIAVGRIKYADINDSSSSISGHEIIIYGYTEYQYEQNGNIKSDCRYLIRDPWMFESAGDKMMSYEKMYNGRDAHSDEDGDESIWYDCVVINTSYDDNTIPYYFNN